MKEKIAFVPIEDHSRKVIFRASRKPCFAPNGQREIRSRWSQIL